MSRSRVRYDEHGHRVMAVNGQDYHLPPPGPPAYIMPPPSRWQKALGVAGIGMLVVLAFGLLFLMVNETRYREEQVTITVQNLTQSGGFRSRAYADVYIAYDDGHTEESVGIRVTYDVFVRLEVGESYRVVAEFPDPFVRIDDIYVPYVLRIIDA